MREKLTIEKPDFIVSIVNEKEVYVQNRLIYSAKKGFIKTETTTDDEIVIQKQFCNAVTSGVDTTVIYVDGHIFDSKEYDIEVILKPKKPTNDES